MSVDTVDGSVTVATLPFVSVVVPVYNAERELVRLMNSLRAQSYPADRIEVLLVDNNSTDSSAEVIKSFPDAKGLTFTDWQSSYASRNVGIEAAQGEVLAFIDADCWAHPDWIRIGVERMLAENLDRVGGRVQFALSQYPNIYEIFDSARNFRMEEFVNRGWTGAGNQFVRREVFADAGLWDPKLISGGDYEFGLRATKTGKSLGFEPDALIYHFARTTCMSLVKKWIRTEYGVAQAYKSYGIGELHLWTKKANYRPLVGVWKEFPPEIQANPHMRLAIDLLSNVLRYSGNLGNFLGYFDLGQLCFRE